MSENGLWAASRSIPSLDGLRAVSISLVIVAHVIGEVPEPYHSLWVIQWMLGWGRLGVAVFFVISGYLITLLLLDELDRTETISLRRFYFRRSLRIFPAFYAFMGVMAILWAADVIPEHWPSFVAAATYTSSYYFAGGYFVAHTWSLSIEEQFYLVWPVLLRRLRRVGAIRFAIAAILIMPVVRLAMYWMVPRLRGMEGFMIQGWIDTMMIGCFLALLAQTEWWEKWKSRYVSSGTTALIALFSFVGLPFVDAKLPGKMVGAFGLPLYFTIQPLAIGFVLLYVVAHPTSLAGRFLNHPAMKHLGVISYGIYLWQQLFTAPGKFPVALGLGLTLAVAELSHWLIERPALKLRSRFDRRMPSYLYERKS